jgi:hypothetical protein
VAAWVATVLLANVPLAPVTGAVNDTATPGTGSLLESSTVTERFVVKAAPVIAVWLLPAFTDI